MPDSWTTETDEGSAAASWTVHPDAEGARLVRLLRTTGSKGGISVPDESEFDAGVSLFLFSDQPVAVRLRRMRQLLSAGVDPHELRTLDDLRNDLAKANAKVGLVDGKERQGGAPEERARRKRQARPGCG